MSQSNFTDRKLSEQETEDIEASLINVSTTQKLEILQFLKIDQNLDDLNDNLVQRIKFYHQKLDDINFDISKIQQQIKKGMSSEYTSFRLNQKQKQKNLFEMQIHMLEKYLTKLITGSQEFKEKKHEILQKLEEQKEVIDEVLDLPQIDDNEAVLEGMQEIDNKLKQIESIKNKTYKIDTDFLDLYQPLFDQFDQDIINEPMVEYTMDNPPTYYPQHGIWFNDEDVSIRKRMTFTAEDEEEFRQMEEEEKAKQKASAEGKGGKKQKKEESKKGFGFLSSLFKR